MTQIKTLFFARCASKFKSIIMTLAGVSLMMLAIGSTASELGRSGALTLTGDAGKKSALHLATKAEMSVKSLQAKVVVTQAFKNDTSDWVEATYTYPLPDDSAIHDLQMYIGERVIVAEIHEKNKAKKIHQAAKAAGKKSALLEQQRPNLFSQKIANIAPGETIKIKISYIQPVQYEAGKFSLRFPMTLTPRYIPGVVTKALVEKESYQLSGGGWASPTNLVPDADLITPPWGDSSTVQNPITLNLTLDAGIAIEQITSATHKINTQKNKTKAGDLYNVSFADKTVPMDRDFELVWQPVSQAAPVAAMFDEHWKNDKYVQLLLMPPRELTEEFVLPRELLLIIDTSGSMDGPSMRQAKESALIALKTLNLNDRFNLIDFNNETHSLFPQAVEVSQNNLTLAKDYIHNLSAGGGTEMEPALARAFAHKAPETHLQQIVFVTDGSVGNEAQLLTQIRRNLGKARLFTVAIGSAPNRYFMQEAANFGRGSLTEISTVSQVQERMTTLLHKLQNPVVSNLKITWPQPTEVFPKVVPDLYWGEPLLVVAKLKPWPLDENAVVTITGITSGKPWQRDIPLSKLSRATAADQKSAKSPVLAKVFGRKKINHLEREFHDQRNSEKARLSILDVALEYGLMSRFTSLVAVDKTPSRPVNAHAKNKILPNMQAHGSTLRAVSYPQTATNFWAHLLTGLLALFFWVFMQKRVARYE